MVVVRGAVVMASGSRECGLELWLGEHAIAQCWERLPPLVLQQEAPLTKATPAQTQDSSVISDGFATFKTVNAAASHSLS